MEGSIGSADGTGSDARFNHPSGVAVDGAGNVYVADRNNNTIRKVNQAGVVTTLAGNALITGQWGRPLGDTKDGVGSAARFAGPEHVAIDSAGNLYVAEAVSHTIRKVTSAGMVTTLAGLAGVYGNVDGTGSAARFAGPSGLAVDRAGNVYVADWVTIRKVTPVGVVTTLAGLVGDNDSGSADGTGNAARFFNPAGVAVDSAGNIYVADTSNNTIRKGISASSVPLPLLMPPSLSTGQFGFGIAGLPGLAVDVETSSDLYQWWVIGTSILEGGTNSFVSPAQPQGTQFYRGHAH